MPKEIYKEWQISLGFWFTVGDIVWQFTISIEQDKWNWWHQIQEFVKSIHDIWWVCQGDRIFVYPSYYLGQSVLYCIDLNDFKK